MWMRNRNLGIPLTEDGLFGNLLTFEYFRGALYRDTPLQTQTHTQACGGVGGGVGGGGGGGGDGGGAGG